jgi:hypothetical protein
MTGTLCSRRTHVKKVKIKAKTTSHNKHDRRNRQPKVRWRQAWSMRSSVSRRGFPEGFPDQLAPIA